MINFDDVIEESIKDHNPNCSQICLIIHTEY